MVGAVTEYICFAQSLGVDLTGGGLREVSRVCPGKMERTREPSTVDLFYKSLNSLKTLQSENDVGVTAEMKSKGKFASW